MGARARKRAKVVAGTALLLSVACSTHHKNTPPPCYDLTGWPQGEVVPLGNCEITLPAGIDLMRRARLLDAIATITSAWASDEGLLPPTAIGVTDEEPECDGGGNFGGCWRGDRFVIVNTTSDTCATLYHELAHRTYQLYGHADPRWSQKWDPRMQDLFLQLRARP